MADHLKEKNMKLNQIRSQMLFAIITVVMLAVGVFAQNPQAQC